MAAASDTLLVTGPAFAQTSAGAVLVTPNGGTQTTLAGALIANGGTQTNLTISGGTIAAGTTLVNSGTISGGVETGVTVDFAATNTIAAAGSTQATGTPLTTPFNLVSTGTLGQGVNSLPSVAGLFELVVNGGTAGVQLLAQQGNTLDVFNALNVGSVGVLIPPGALSISVAEAAGAIQNFVVNPKKAGYIANTASAAATLTAASLAQADVLNVVNMTGSLAGGANLTLPAATAYLAALAGAGLNSGSVLRVMNSSAGAASWTLTAGAGFGANGTLTIAQNTAREFAISVVNGTSCAAQDIGGLSII